MTRIKLPSSRRRTHSTCCWTWCTSVSWETSTNLTWQGSRWDFTSCQDCCTINSSSYTAILVHMRYEGVMETCYTLPWWHRTRYHDDRVHVISTCVLSVLLYYTVTMTTHLTIPPMCPLYLYSPPCIVCNVHCTHNVYSVYNTVTMTTRRSPPLSTQYPGSWQPSPRSFPSD